MLYDITAGNLISSGVLTPTNLNSANPFSRKLCETKNACPAIAYENMFPISLKQAWNQHAIH